MYRHFFKRFLDIILSGTALIVLSPVLAVTGILVRVKLGSPVIFTQERPGYREKLRHTVRPGLTGLAQVSGRNRLKWDERLEKDAEYVENLSIALD
ncbi:MAG: sugar transferase, partial [Lachnospiraceae bacterium]|nr:sugar transferase [Lachnospiraceae bacterium]